MKILMQAYQLLKLERFRLRWLPKVESRAELAKKGFVLWEAELIMKFCVVMRRQKLEKLIQKAIESTAPLKTNSPECQMLEREISGNFHNKLLLIHYSTFASVLCAVEARAEEH